LPIANVWDFDVFNRIFVTISRTCDTLRIDIIVKLFANVYVGVFDEATKLSER